MNTRIDKKLVKEYRVADTEAAFDEMLDECYSFNSVGGPFQYLRASEVMKEMLPTDYRCGHVDWLDSECSDDRYYEASDGNHYDAKSVNDAAGEVVDEINDEIKELEMQLGDEEDDDKISELEKQIEALNEELSDVEDCRL